MTHDPLNPYDSPEYQRFVEDMAKHCHCAPHLRPCDGVLAGGVCDNMGNGPEDENRSYDPDFEEDYD